MKNKKTLLNAEELSKVSGGEELRRIEILENITPKKQFPPIFPFIDGEMDGPISPFMCEPDPDMEDNLF